MKNRKDLTVSTKPFDLELDNLLHPAQFFVRPQHVIDASDLTIDQKRAILASWACDACAVEAAPMLRRAPGGERIVNLDEILEALCTLDRDSRDSSASWKRRPSIGASSRSRARYRSSIDRGLPN